MEEQKYHVLLYQIAFCNFFLNVFNFSILPFFFFYKIEEQKLFALLIIFKKLF